jgi:hypothetical protein
MGTTVSVKLVQENTFRLINKERVKLIKEDIIPGKTA